MRTMILCVHLGSVPVASPSRRTQLSASMAAHPGSQHLHLLTLRAWPPLHNSPLLVIFQALGYIPASLMVV